MPTRDQIAWEIFRGLLLASPPEQNTPEVRAQLATWYAYAYRVADWYLAQTPP